MALNRDEFQTLADTHYDSDGYESGVERAFSMLVDLAAHVYESYLDEDRIDLDNPASFTPSTLAGVSHGFALVAGLIENLELKYPDAQFRRAV